MNFTHTVSILAAAAALAVPAVASAQVRGGGHAGFARGGGHGFVARGGGERHEWRGERHEWRGGGERFEHRWVAPRYYGGYYGYGGGYYGSYVAPRVYAPYYDYDYDDGYYAPTYVAPPVVRRWVAPRVIVRPRVFVPRWGWRR